MNKIVKSNITFINHASIKISNNETSLLTDPWYEGEAFNKGWSLLYENEEKKILQILSEIQFIWISHEHPDHFSVLFFKKYLNIIKKNNIKVIFQNTKDKRVINFFKNLNISVIELVENKFLYLSKDFKIKIIKSDFYDSALIIHVDDKVIFNLNDCPINDEKNLKSFKRKHGKCDILLTQFSYAAWKGGKLNEKWRIHAAEQKLETIKLQSKILKPRTIIPFASFIYFANIENFYLNDHSNKVSTLISYSKNNHLNFIIMQPFEKQDINNIKQNNQSIKFWEDIYLNINHKPKFEYNKPINEFEIIEAFNKYQNLIFKKNSKILLYLISKIPYLSIFSSLKILMTDTNTVYLINLFKGVKKTLDNKYDISMNSNSLLFLLKNNFGFDTLTVNGCFDIYDFNSFSKFAKFFSIGNLNNLGIFINLKVLINFNLFILFLQKLRHVRNNIPDD